MNERDVSRASVALTVRQMVIDADYWNRQHPNDEPLPIDDERGTLAAALRAIGLSLDEIVASVRADEGSMSSVVGGVATQTGQYDAPVPESTGPTYHGGIALHYNALGAALPERWRKAMEVAAADLFYVSRGGSMDARTLYAHADELLACLVVNRPRRPVHRATNREIARASVRQYFAPVVWLYRKVIEAFRRTYPFDA